MECHIFVKSEAEVSEWSMLTGLSEGWLMSEYVKAHQDGYLCVLKVNLTPVQYHNIKKARHIDRPDFWEFTGA